MTTSCCARRRALSIAAVLVAVATAAPTTPLLSSSAAATPSNTAAPRTSLHYTVRVVAENNASSSTSLQVSNNGQWAFNNDSNVMYDVATGDDYNGYIGVEADGRPSDFGQVFGDPVGTDAAAVFQAGQLTTLSPPTGIADTIGCGTSGYTPSKIGFAAAGSNAQGVVAGAAIWTCNDYQQSAATEYSTSGGYRVTGTFETDPSSNSTADFVTDGGIFLGSDGNSGTEVWTDSNQTPEPIATWSGISNVVPAATAMLWNDAGHFVDYGQGSKGLELVYGKGDEMPIAGTKAPVTFHPNALSDSDMIVGDINADAAGDAAEIWTQGSGVIKLQSISTGPVTMTSATDVDAAGDIFGFGSAKGTGVIWEATPTVTKPGPAIKISSPKSGHHYGKGDKLKASFTCKPPAGAGIKVTSCKGTVADGKKISTTKPGKRSFTVTAKSSNGGTSKKTIHYVIN